jgi:hypothetical protein
MLLGRSVEKIECGGNGGNKACWPVGELGTRESLKSTARAVKIRKIV